MDRHFSGKSRFETIFPAFEYSQAVPEPSPCARHHAHFLPASVRAKTFDEAVSALRPEEAYAEASRCLRCDIRETVAHAISRG